MPRASTCNFLVVELSEEVIQMEVISNRSKTITVPKEHSRYSQTVEECICSDIQKGSVVEAELVNTSEGEWRFESIMGCRKP